VIHSKKAIVAALVIAATVAASAQQRADSSAASVFKALRTPWGDPDLQGTWPTGSLMVVPFERPPDMGTRATLTAEEAAARNAAFDATSSATAPPTAFLQPFWNEYGRAPALTSLIADPANGRLPEMTADGSRRAREWQTKAAPSYPYAGPQDMRPLRVPRG
jgi:hypothetical protein